MASTAKAKDKQERETQPSEEEKVIAWHLDQLERLGFTPSESAALVLAGCNVPLMRRLLERGCSKVLAAQIST